MKFMEKIYRAFCADEVKLMLDHMEENFADFQDYDNKWYELLDDKHFTTVERTAINLANRRLKANKKRQELLGAILSQKLNPVKGRYKEAEAKHVLHAQLLINQQKQYNQQLAQNMLAGQNQQHIQTQQQYELALEHYRQRK